MAEYGGVETGLAPDPAENVLQVGNPTCDRGPPEGGA